MIHRTLKTAILLAGEVLLLLAVRSLGRRDELQITWSTLPDWLDRTAPEDAIVAVVRLGAEGVAWWLCLATAIYGLAMVFGNRSVAHTAGRLLPAVLRRWVEASAAVALSVGFVATASPVGAASSPAAVPTHAYVPTPAGDPAPPAIPVAQTPATAATTRMVAPGDSLWSIAADLVAERTGQPVSDLADEEVHAVWVDLVERNRDRLLSGDADLIHPGETIVP